MGRRRGDRTAVIDFAPLGDRAETGGDIARDYNRQLWLNARGMFGADYADDPIEWMQTRFYIPELMGPIKLAPYQIGALREAYRRTEDNQYRYRLVVWSDLKKSAKSTIAAAVVLERARRTRFGSFKIVANSLQQADSRVAFYFRRAFELAELLNDPFEGVDSRRLLTEFDNFSKVISVPVNPGTQAGGNDDLVTFSELWAANTKAHEQMWTEMTLSPLKDGQRWVETYAGIEGESPLLEPLYHRLVKDENRIDISYVDPETGDYVDLSDIEAYADGYTFCLWNTQQGLHWWQTDDYYAAEREALLPEEFSRVHENTFSSPVSKLVPNEWWNECVIHDAEEWPRIRKREGVIIALDAGVNNDSFGIVAGVRRGDHTYIIYTQKWVAPKGGKIDYTGTRKDPGPELELRRLLRTYRVLEVRYDRYMLHDMMTKLGNKPRFKKIDFVDFPQGAKRAVADRQLYEVIREQRVHTQPDPDLTEHVQNANRKNLGDNRMRIVKRTDEKKIDLTICMSMLVYVDEKEKKPKKQPDSVTVAKVDNAWSKQQSTRKDRPKRRRRRRNV